MQFLSIYTLIATLVWGQLAFCDIFTPPSQWENLELNRVVDLSSTYTKEKVELTVKNIDNNDTKDYYFALPSSIVEKLAIFSVSLPNKEAFLSSIFIDETTDLEDGNKLGYALIEFPQPVEPGEQVSFVVEFSYTKINKPFPQHIGLEDDQHLLFESNRFPISAYRTDQSSLMITGSTSFEDFSLKEYSEDDIETNQLAPEILNAGIRFGNWHNIDSFNIQYPLRVSFVHNGPLKRVMRTQREAWISHWASTIQFSEEMDLVNDGARLEHGFSRLEFLQSQMKNNLRYADTILDVALPNGATNYVFKDLVGLVSTFHVEANHFYLKPRYPVMGGWKYNFTIGWTNDLTDFLHKLNGNDDTYIASVPLINGPSNSVYDEVTLSLYLPEGAEFIAADAPMPYSNFSVEGQKSYFDLANGHVKVTFKFANLVDEIQNARVLVQYRYSSLAAYKKILNIAGYIFAALISFFGLKTLNLRV